MNQLRYALYSMAAALMAAGESLKASADNVPVDMSNAEFVDPGTGEVQTGGTIVNIGALDKAGLPWDERIHASTKTIKADGTWTKRKGATPPVVATVEAELRAKYPAPVVATSTPTPPPVTGGVPLPSLGVPGLPLPVIAKLTKYQELCAFLAANTGAGKPADDAWVAAAFAGWSTSLAALAGADDATNEAYLAEFKRALTPA